MFHLLLNFLARKMKDREFEKKENPVVIYPKYFIPCLMTAKCQGYKGLLVDIINRSYQK